MELVLDRKFKKEKYTIGKLYVKNGEELTYIMDVIEDKDRGLKQSDELSTIKKIKVFGETAIPVGRYEINMSIKSPKFSNFAKYPQYKKYNGVLPRLVNVKGYEGILIHIGSSEKSSHGCLIVGKNDVVGKVTKSEYYFNKLMDEYLIPASKIKEKIFITIK